MKTFRSVADLRTAVRTWRAAGDKIAFVPTMGALHAGHMALVAAVRGDHDRVVASIFVNPTQFGNPGDLAAYPRTEDRDAAMLAAAGVDALFLPGVADIYPPGDQTVVEVTGLSSVFHGAVRPGHFRGVTTVVARLFNIVQPDTAAFGEKDYQQLAIIRRMVADLHIPVAIRAVPTLRDADGLALSSRNARLTALDRAAAPVLSRALDAAERLAGTGALAEDLLALIERTIRAEPRARFRAADAVWAHDFTPATGPIRDALGLMISAEFGPADNPVLLIDQREIQPMEG